MKKYLFMVVICILFVSCMTTKRISNPKTPEAPDLSGTKKRIAENAEKVTEASEGIGKIASDIDEQTSSIEKKDEEKKMTSEVLSLRSDADQLRLYKDKLQQITLGLRKSEGELVVAQRKADDLETVAKGKDVIIANRDKVIEEQTVKIADLESEKQAALRSRLTYLIMLGIIMIAICGFMFVNGKPRAIGVGVVGVLIVIISLAVSYFTMPLAIAGAVGLVVVLGIGGYVAYRKRGKEIAINELTASVEHMKPHLPKEMIETLFGDLIGDGSVGQLQSRFTKDMVNKARTKLAKRVSPTIPTESSNGKIKSS